MFYLKSANIITKYVYSFWITIEILCIFLLNGPKRVFSMQSISFGVKYVMDSWDWPGDMRLIAVFVL